MILTTIVIPKQRCTPVAVLAEWLNERMEWNGMEWKGVEWNGMEWNEMNEFDCMIRRNKKKRCLGSHAGIIFKFLFLEGIFFWPGALSGAGRSRH